MERVIAVNRRAYYDYHILESLEAGIALTGTEVKSIRLGRANLREAFAQPENGELWLLGAHIARYEPGGPHNHEPTRPRKLLLRREQIDRLVGELSTRRLTLVPLKLYLKGRRIKLELGLAKGKRLYDKREAIKEREVEREIHRALISHKERKG